MHGKQEFDRNPEPAGSGSPPADFSPCSDAGPPHATACRDRPETSGDHRWAPVLDACLAELTEAVENGDMARTPPLIEAAAELALIERGAVSLGSRRRQQALRVGHLCLARRLITRHLSQASLSPAMMADLLGVSVRYLHMLFEATGKSFSQTVTALRVRQSCLLLRETPKQPIANIAHACGFGSLPTFYRVFSATTGLTPSEFRAQRELRDVVDPARSGREAATHLTGK